MGGLATVSCVEISTHGYIFQIKPSQSVGWTPFCKILKDIQYISSFPQGDQRCQLLGVYEIMRKMEYSGDNTNFIEGGNDFGKTCIDSSIL